MKTLIIKWLGLAALAEKVKTLETENSRLVAEVETLTEKVDEIEIPDLDNYMTESDLESYLYDNDYITQSYCDDEIESKVSEKVEEAIDEMDIESKVREVVSEMDKASFGDTQELKNIVRKVLEEMVKALADQAR